MTISKSALVQIMDSCLQMQAEAQTGVHLDVLMPFGVTRPQKAMIVCLFTLMFAALGFVFVWQICTHTLKLLNHFFIAVSTSIMSFIEIFTERGYKIKWKVVYIPVISFIYSSMVRTIYVFGPISWFKWFVVIVETSSWVLNLFSKWDSINLVTTLSDYLMFHVNSLRLSDT